jgi:hypothetical protein
MDVNTALRRRKEEGNGRDMLEEGRDDGFYFWNS